MSRQWITDPAALERDADTLERSAFTAQDKDEARSLVDAAKMLRATAVAMRAGKLTAVPVR